LWGLLLELVPASSRISPLSPCLQDPPPLELTPSSSIVGCCPHPQASFDRRWSPSSFVRLSQPRSVTPRAAAVFQLPAPPRSDHLLPLVLPELLRRPQPRLCTSMWQNSVGWNGMGERHDIPPIWGCREGPRRMGDGLENPLEW
jgi:hypothetical protein